MAISPDENHEVEEADGRRSRVQKTLTMKAGDVETFGKVDRCRKIYCTVARGTIQWEIRGDYHSDMVCHAGFAGGPLSGGGGDFTPADLIIRLSAPVDAEVYVHVEWEKPLIF